MGLTSSEKAGLIAAIAKQNLQDLSEYHRRLHMQAKQGNLLTGFSKADMDEFHGNIEKAMCKLHKQQNPPTDCAPASPLEWGALRSDQSIEKDADVILAKCGYIDAETRAIRDRVQAEYKAQRAKEKAEARAAKKMNKNGGNEMELDDEYFQTISETPLQSPEFLGIMAKMAKAAPDAKAKQALEMALKILEAHEDVSGVSDIVDDLKDAMSGKGSDDDEDEDEDNDEDTNKKAKKSKSKKSASKKMKKEEDGIMTKEALAELPDAVKVYFDRLQKDGEAKELMLKQQLEKITDLENKEKLRGYMAKAAEFDTLPQDGLAEHMMEIGEQSPEALNWLETTLRTANESNKRGKLFEEAGTDKVVEGVDAEIEKIAQGLMAKSTDITPQAARVAAVRANAKLYDEFEKKRLSGRGA
jgi:hypothetical protein